MTYLPFTIESVRQETSNCKSFVLKPDGVFSYHPGQFITLVIPHPGGDIRRSYSFSSHPSIEPPTITIKRIANGEVSRRLFDRGKEGDQLLSIGASGFFTLPAELPADQTLFFLAAGSGITPIFSLIKEALLYREVGKVVLAYSNRSQIESIFYDELKALEKKFSSSFRIEFFFSNDHDLNRARLGRLALEKLLVKYLHDTRNALFYLCGPHVYMQSNTIALLTAGVPPDNIRKEIFFNPLPTVVIVPPDTARHQVSIRYQGKDVTFPVQYPQTILSAAKELNIPIPFSCEAGRCGTCAATCTHGEVWMLRNEVLLDKEMANGRVLTCTGYPVGGDVDLYING